MIRDERNFMGYNFEKLMNRQNYSFFPWTYIILANIEKTNIFAGDL